MPACMYPEIGCGAWWIMNTGSILSGFEQGAVTARHSSYSQIPWPRALQGTNECHEWMGVKYQPYPRDADGEIVILLRMLDRENGSGNASKFSSTASEINNRATIWELASAGREMPG